MSRHSIAAISVGILCLLTFNTLWSSTVRAATVLATQDIRVSQSSDDAEEISGFATDTISSDLELVTESAVQSVGIRFNGLNIPRGATVTSAYIQFKVDEATTVATSLLIQGEAADNAITFSGASGVYSRTLTTASVPWSPAPWSSVGAATVDQQTPDIAAVIEEIVNRPGWAIGNSLVIVINGSGVRVAESVDGDPNGAPLLHLEYELTDQYAPIADAGADQEITLPASTSLNGTVSDDGLPSPPATLSTLWTQQSGPGTAAFGSSTALNTSISFPVPGTYVLRLTATDSEKTDYDELTIAVKPEPVPPVLASFSPSSAQTGMVVTLSGSKLIATNSVSFNGIPANFWVAGDSTIHATVPAGSASGTITVSNPWGSATSAAAFSRLSSPSVLVGAGDISNCAGAEEQVAKVLDTIPGSVFTSGDNAYNGASATTFNNCYHPTWGRHKARTRPAVGNTDYVNPGAAGYYNYFGAAAGAPDKGYYSYDIGNWHVVTLNSQCAEAGGCERDSAQGIWLREDLAKNPQACTVAIWHHPRYGSSQGEDVRLIDFWKILYDAGVELVVNGHDHNYERFALQDPYGNVDPLGIREIIVGTGGVGLHLLSTIAPNSLVRNDTTHGVLKLTLNPGNYNWEFVPVAGGLFTDTGSDVCRTVNQSPFVYAGPDETIIWPDDAVLLQGRALDDGYPSPPASFVSNWSQLSGPGTAEFDDGTQAETSVSFSELGRYVLRLSGDDGELVSTDDVEVLVTEPGVQVFNVQFRVSTGNDDAEQAIGSGQMSLNSSDLELIRDSTPAISDQLVGLRFNGISIPQGASIWSAHIQFQVDEATVNPATLSIAAEATDHSAVFTKGAGNLSARPVTTASVPWAPPPWTAPGLAGAAQQTSDLGQVIQEVIDRPGWSSGNSMTLLISGSGQRIAESYDSIPGAAPLLVIEYAIGINTAPNIAITAPSNGASVGEGSGFTFMGTAQDDTDGDISPAINWHSNLDGDIGSGGTVNATLSVGVHTITASIIDSGGKTDSEQITVTVTPNVAPAVNITDPANGTTIAEGNSLTFAGSSNDDEDGNISSSIAWSSSIDNGLGSGASVTATLSPGTHTITASITDSGGLSNSAQITVTITATPNTSPGVSITSPADGTSVAEGTQLSFAGTATDNEDGDISASLAWASSLDGSLGSGAGVDATLSAGVHTISASVTDSGGLPGNAQLTVTISSNAPRVVSIDVLPGDSANIVYPNQSGNLPVAVLSSAEFDATQVNQDSLRFGLGEAAPTGNVVVADVDGQFGNDKTFRFPMQQSGISCNDNAVSLYGETISGEMFSGTGAIDATQCETGGCHAY